MKNVAHLGIQVSDCRKKCSSKRVYVYIFFFKSHTTYRAEEFREKKMVSSFVLNGFSCLEKWNCNNKYKYKYNTELANKYRLLGFSWSQSFELRILILFDFEGHSNKNKNCACLVIPPNSVLCHWLLMWSNSRLIANHQMADGSTLDYSIYVMWYVIVCIKKYSLLILQHCTTCQVLPIAF